MVTRDLGLKEQYRGAASIVTGEIDEDVEAYLRQSEQLDSALGCEVTLDGSGAPRAAGGLLVQAMPGGEPTLIREVQHALRTSALHDVFAAEPPPERAVDVALAVLPDRGLQLLDERAVAFACRCSADRALTMLEVFETSELEDMLTRDGGAEVTCSFCAER